jgi:hypothetical protein
MILSSFVYAEETADIENRLFTDNIENLVKAVRAGKHLHITSARAYPNEHEDEQLRYCNRLMSQMWGTIRPASDFMPKPVYSTATHGNEFIRKFLFDRVSRCKRNTQGYFTMLDFAMFDLKWGEPYFRVYNNPQRTGSHILMQILVTTPGKGIRPIEEAVGDFEFEKKSSQESCFGFEEAGLGGAYPGGPNRGVLLFDRQIMAYTLGTTDADCPEDNPCPKHDFDMNYTYFLRLFPLNTTEDLFGAAYIKALKKAVENPDEASFTWNQSVSWNPNYICTIYFD